MTKFKIDVTVVVTIREENNLVDNDADPEPINADWGD